MTCDEIETDELFDDMAPDLAEREAKSLVHTLDVWQRKKDKSHEWNESLYIGEGTAIDYFLEILAEAQS